VIKTLHDYRKRVHNVQGPVNLRLKTVGFGEECSLSILSQFNVKQEFQTGRCVPKGCRAISQSGYEGPLAYHECNMLPIEEVILFYWPSDPSSTDILPINGSKVFTFSADRNFPQRIISNSITFDGQDVYPRGMIIGGNYTRLQEGYVSPYSLPGLFTFTSPTVYIAHRQIRVLYTSMNGPAESFNTALPGTTMEVRPPGVLPVDPKSIFSLRHFPRNTVSGIEFARIVASGKYDPGWGVEEPYVQIRPLNFVELEHQVPASVYYEARSEDCFGQQTHCATITVRS
jgi:hypothetical protein